MMTQDELDAWYQKGQRALQAYRNRYDLASVSYTAQQQQPSLNVLALAKQAQPYIDKLTKRVHKLVARPESLRRVAKRGTKHYVLMKMPKSKTKIRAAQYALVNVRSELQNMCQQCFGPNCFILYTAKVCHLTWS